jgi:hypothetical protein
LKLKNKLTYLIAPAVLCWCLFYLQGCKEPLIKENNLLTSDDNLNLAKDTLSVKVFSEFEKPLNSNGVAVGLLGSINDPNFGKTFASFYAQCQLTSNNIYFGVLPEFDSEFLMVQYNGQYGKFSDPVDVNVYELSQDLNDSTTYHTNDAFSVNIPPIGTLNGFVPRLTDSVVTTYGTLAPHIRIPLSTTFANKILKADTNTLRDNAAFINLFKGIYLTTSSSTVGNGLLYLTLQSPVSGIKLYYHNSSIDSLSYTLPFSGVTVNHFDNVYTGSPVSSSITSPNINGEEKMYLQAGAGVKGKIFINHLDSLPKNIAINKAELILSKVAQTSTIDTFPAPLVLNMFRIDDAGQAQRLEDDGTTGFGGVLTDETVNGIAINRYHFNIKRYFQKLIQGIYPNRGFYLETISPNSNSERVVIANSSTDKNYQITLVITYTKL